MNTLDAILYPPIEPYASGMLDVGDGHLVYWEECGNPVLLDTFDPMRTAGEPG